MSLLHNDDGSIQHIPLQAFRMINVLGIFPVLKLEYTTLDEQPTSIQFSLTLEQCKELAEQLLIQADILEMERPTQPQ